MKPLGRTHIKFPNKTKEWLGRGIRMWWEGICTVNKKRARRQAKREAIRERNNLADVESGV